MNKTLEERFEWHSEREAYKAGFREALDACREKIEKEMIAFSKLRNQTGSGTLAAQHKYDGIIAGLQTGLNQIDSLRTVGGKE